MNKNDIFPTSRGRQRAFGRVYKTYSRGISASITCFDAMNILFAKNLTERKLKGGGRKRKQKILIKELPQNVKSALSNESLDVNIDNTFDRLVKGVKFNEVNVKDTAGNVDSSSGEKTSSAVRSLNFDVRSPILTRSKSSLNIAKSNSSNDTNSWFKQKTLSKNRIDNSLEIEKGLTGMSVIKQVSIQEIPIQLANRDDTRMLTETAKDTESHEYEGSQVTQNASFFSNSWKEKIHASTPLVSVNKKYVIKRDISPTIHKYNEVEELIAQSLQEIEDWNCSYPTPQVRSANLVRSYSLNSFSSLAFKAHDKQHTSNDGLGSRCNFASRSLRKFGTKLDDSVPNSKLFNSRSYSLNEFENFEKKITQTNATNDTYPVTEQTRSFCLKKFEEFQEKYKDLPNFQYGGESNEFSRNTCVTRRRSFRKRQLLSVNEKFNMKNLIVVMDDILLTNKTADLKKKSKIKNGTQQLKPLVVKLVQMSLNDLGKCTSPKGSLTDLQSEKWNPQAREVSVNLTKSSTDEINECEGRFSQRGEEEKSDCPDPSRSTRNKRSSAKIDPNCTTPSRNSSRSSSVGRKELVVSLINHRTNCSNLDCGSCFNDSFDSSSEFEGFPGASTTSDKSRRDFVKSVFVDLATNRDFLGADTLQTDIVNFNAEVLRSAQAPPTMNWNPGIFFDSTNSLSEGLKLSDNEFNKYRKSTSMTDISKSFDQRKVKSTWEPLYKSKFENSASMYSNDKKLALSVTENEGDQKTVTARDRKTELDITEESDKENQCPKGMAKGVGWPNSSRTPLKTPLSESCNVTNLTDVFKHSELEDDFKLPLPLDSFSFVTLRAGKLWRKSLRDHRRYSVLNSKSPAPVSQRRQSMRIVPVVSNVTSRKTSILQDYAKTILTEDSEVDASVRPQSPLIITAITAKDLVLQKCRQSEPMPFEKCYPESLLRDCRKIGEGAYGEVFLYRNPDGSSTVMKVIPIEGATEINGDRQKKFDEILSEIVISSELSGLRQGVVNQSSAFAEVKRICCVYGKYPERLLALWDEFDVEKGSENDRPEMFDESQLYIVLDLANAGADLEAFQFNNAAQALSMVRQVACALAVAEQRLKFEHRDLHWGNVLLEGVSRNTKLSYKLKDKRNEIQTRGVRATIIDFTLSRIEHDGVVIYNDLGQDPELFVAQGDYQFEVYRLMRRRNGNDWEKFEPYSNTLWLHYIVDKSITALRYKNVNTKVHKDNIDKLKEIRDTILDYDCATNFIESLF